MAKLRATSNYFGTNGYRKAEEIWEVSDEEAKQMIDAGHPVELVKEEKSSGSKKEDKDANSRKTK